MCECTVIVEHDPEAAACSVLVPALPGCTSQGRTLDEALANAREAITGHIAAMKELGEPIAEEANRPQAIRIDIAA